MTQIVYSLDETHVEQDLVRNTKQKEVVVQHIGKV